MQTPLVNKLVYIMSTDASEFEKAQCTYRALLLDDPNVFVKNMSKLDAIQDLARRDPNINKRNNIWYYKDREVGETIIAQSKYYSTSVKGDTYSFCELGLPLIKVNKSGIFVNMRIMEDLDTQGGLLNYNFIGLMKRTVTSANYLISSKSVNLYNLFVELPSYVSEYALSETKIIPMSRETVIVVDIVSGEEMLF